MNSDCKIKLSPLVSIIVPVYNVEKYVHRCVESILSQTYANIEVILVNDGSTDNSLKQIEKYKSDARCLVIDKQNGGQSTARNAGLDVAQGDFIYFVDSDDYIQPDAIKLLLSCMEQSQADFCCYRIAFFREGATPSMVVHGHDFEYESLDAQDAIIHDAFLCRNIKTSVCSKFWRHTFLVEHKLRFQEGLINEDTLFTLSAALSAGKVAFLNQVLYCALIRQSSTSRDIKPQNITCYFEIYRIIETSLRNMGNYEKYERYFWASYTKSILYSLVVSAYQIKSVGQYVNLFQVLLDQPYVTTTSFCSSIRLCSKFLGMIYRWSLHPKSFYRAIQISRKLGVGLSSIK